MILRNFILKKYRPAKLIRENGLSGKIIFKLFLKSLKFLLKFQDIILPEQEFLADNDSLSLIQTFFHYVFPVKLVVLFIMPIIK
jgi:hypothetical protein